MIIDYIKNYFYSIVDLAVENHKQGMAEGHPVVELQVQELSCKDKVKEDIEQEDNLADKHVVDMLHQLEGNSEEFEDKKFEGEAP